MWEAKQQMLSTCFSNLLLPQLVGEGAEGELSFSVGYPLARLEHQ